MHKIRLALLSLTVLLWGAQMSLSAAAEEPRPGSSGQTASRPPAARPAAPSRPYAPPSAGRPAVDGRGQVLDARYNHGRYYPPVGAVTRSLPPDYRPYYRGG